MKYIQTWDDFDPTHAEYLNEASKTPCRLQVYTPLNVVPEFQVRGCIRAYASPDSTFSVTKDVFDNAETSILIGIYDFTANWMLELLENALNRGVTVSLMLDVAGDKERSIMQRLEEKGARVKAAPSCYNKEIHYFPRCHEKVIVVDNRLTFIQSGNYTTSSIPKGKRGNRDTGLLFDDANLASFFTNVLNSDMELKAPKALLERYAGDFVHESIVFKVLKPRGERTIFPAQDFNKDGQTIKVQPVLTPDNYMEPVLKLLKEAKRSIVIEQQYIWTKDQEVQKLISAITEAKRAADASFSVQIIVASAFMVDDEKAWGDIFQDARELQRLGFEVKLLPKNYFSHCHNKMIVVDDENVLISSQNWSDEAVSQNREAGVIIYNSEIASYFKKIFNEDWRLAEDDIEQEKINSQVKHKSITEEFRGMPTFDEFKDMIEVDLSDIEQF